MLVSVHQLLVGTLVVVGKEGVMVSNGVTREQIARPVSDLVERFGFRWEVEDEYPLPDLGQRPIVLVVSQEPCG